MNDCPNAEMRDLLPDLLHERLEVSMRAAVTAHVDTCEDCRAELQLLEGVHRMLTKQTPRVDVSYIVGALPLAAKPKLARPVQRRRWADWRIAAAVAALAVGGTSVAVLERSNGIMVSNDTMNVVQVLQSDSTPVSRASVNVAANTTPAKHVAPVRTESPSATKGATTEQVATTANDGIGVGRSAGNLSQTQLRALLDDIDNMQALPITEPEPVSLKVEGTSSSGEPEGM